MNLQAVWQLQQFLQPAFQVRERRRVRSSVIGHKTQQPGAGLAFGQLVVSDAVDIGKALIELPDSDPSAARGPKRFGRPAVDDIARAIRQFLPLDQVADLVSQQRHEIVGERRDNQRADAGLIRFEHLQQRGFKAGPLLSLFILHQQMAGLG